MNDYKVEELLNMELPDAMDVLDELVDTDPIELRNISWELLRTLQEELKR